MLDENFVSQLFNWFGLSLEASLKLWSNQIIIMVLIPI